MEMIKGHCTTNLDDYDVSKVNEFARVPNKEERVSCTYKGNSTSLKIVQITHTIKDNKPYVIIELHK